MPTFPYSITISRLDQHYYIYDSSTTAQLRARHRISGVLVGTLPQSPQQNVFMGLPLQLMPEEVLLLVGTGLAYVVDDATAHRKGLVPLERDARIRWRKCLDEHGAEMTQGMNVWKEEGKRRAFQAQGRAPNWEVNEAFVEAGGPRVAEDEDMGAQDNNNELGRRDEKGFRSASVKAADDTDKQSSYGSELSIHSSPEDVLEPSTKSHRIGRKLRILRLTQRTIPYCITPTTSYPPLPAPTRSTTHSSINELLPSPPPPPHPLYAYLHGLSYYLFPGLRFGCHYLVYPGDPLRFHSHFLAIGRDWHEEVDLMSLIGAGRLGTGVKKGFLVGGVESENYGAEHSKRPPVAREEGRVRCFCIEWGGI